MAWRGLGWVGLGRARLGKARQGLEEKLTTLKYDVGEP